MASYPKVHHHRSFRMSIPQLDLDRIEGIADAVIESMNQLQPTIETTSTRLSATMLRDQTLGIIAPISRTLIQADFTKANVTVILALYKDPDPKDYSTPAIIIANEKNLVCAAVVRTYYNTDLQKSVMVTTIKGPDCTSEFKALEGLYARSRAAMQRAINFSKNAEGFDFWEDLDL